MKFRYSFILLFIFLLQSGHILGQEEYSVKIKVKDTEDSIAYLGYHFADKRYVLDTAQFDDNSTVVYTRNEPYDPGLYFYYTPNTYFEFIINEPEMYLETEGEDFIKNMIVHKSVENKIFLEMQKFVSSERTLYNELVQKMEEGDADSTEIDTLRTQIQEIDRKVKEFQNKLADENDGTFTAKMIRAMQKPDVPDSLIGESRELADKRYKYYKNHFFDHVNIADAGLLRTPILNQKILEYLDKVIVQIPDSVIKEVDWLLSEAKKDKAVYRYALVTLTSKYETSNIMGMDKVFVHLVEKYYLSENVDWVDDETRQKMAERIATMKPNFIGNQAPPMNLNDTLLSSVSLYDIPAEYIVLYFYDPDCGHCKKVTPELYDSYARLRNQNVEILAINITNDMDRWKEYIRENQFDWINLADSNNKSNFRYYYDIRSTPTIYILDRDKKIIAKKIDVSQIESFLEKVQEAELERN